MSLHLMYNLIVSTKRCLEISWLKLLDLSHRDQSLGSLTEPGSPSGPARGLPLQSAQCSARRRDGTLIFKHRCPGLPLHLPSEREQCHWQGSQCQVNRSHGDADLGKTCSCECSEAPVPLPTGKVIKRNVSCELRFRVKHKDVSAFSL